MEGGSSEDLEQKCVMIDFPFKKILLAALLRIDGQRTRPSRGTSSEGDVII